MMNSDAKRISAEELQDSCTVSVIISTQNDDAPACMSPQKVKGLIPKTVSREVIVVHYNSTSEAVFDIDTGTPRQFGANFPNKSPDTEESLKKNDILHVKIKSKFTHAIMEGVELSNGNFILVIDGDFPYPDDVIHMMIDELINSPNSIIIASKYVKGSSIQKLPLMRTVISKWARIIVRHGLNVREVEDPLSGCFAIPKSLLDNIQIEGNGDELLLEILVKLNRNSGKDHKVTVKEIPFKLQDKMVSKKIDLTRIMSYSLAIWHLYRYGHKSKQLQNESDIAEQRKHKSVLFLSKAGRFFTVGASGFIVNYLVSFLLANAVSNIWYVHATFFGIIVSITTNFLLNKIWTFEDRDFSVRHFLKQYLTFLCLCALGAVIQLSLVFVFVEYSHIQYGMSLIMAVCVASLGNFLLNKKITFGEKMWE